MSANWKKEWSDTARALRAQRLNHRTIAKRLSEQFPERSFTESNVQKHFARLRNANAHVTKESKGRLLPAPAAGGAHQTPQAITPLAATGKPIAEIGVFECRFEVTGTKNKREYRFCGKPVRMQHPFSYCENHCRIVYQPDVPRQRGK